MWINDEVNIPEPLITAQREGNLVIFAGAGVSMGSPSNFPDFKNLATMIARRNIEKGDDDRLDRFLGRVESTGTNVQARAREILTTPESRPTKLHVELIRLLGTSNSHRLVTTNFDTHFTTALHDLNPLFSDIYYAPALPLGNNFQGLVYLHGSVERRDPLVLTDSDFGKAYLTEGWATQFLMRMFEEFTVLFVGYSHQDPVMQYLARGFVTESERYALVPGPESDNHWNHYGITPIHYPDRPPPDKHGALTDAMKAWSKRANLGVLDQENRIREIVQAPPPLDNEVLDYLDSVIKDTVTLRFLVKHTKLVEWLLWVEEKGLLNSLFIADRLSDEKSRLIADWFTRNFAVDHANQALDIMRKKGPELNPLLWHALAMVLAQHEPRPSADVLGRWVLILVNSSKPGHDNFYLELLLSECKYPDEEHIALLLFSYLAHPVIQLEQSWQLGDKGSALPRPNQKIRGGRYMLDKAWSGYFLPQMTRLYKRLRPMLTYLLIKAEFSMETWDGSYLHYRRHAIEDHEQDRHKDDWQFLIDAARDLLEWLLENESIVGKAVIEEWSRENSLLLKRLAIHGMAVNRILSSNSALETIEQRDWLYSRGLKHEVFRLIERAFPNASIQVQERFVRYSMNTDVMQDLDDPSASEKLRDIRDYERYNLAVWLHRVAPDSSVARNHFEQLQKNHPEFKPREHPDFEMWSGEFKRITPKSPIIAEDLEKYNASEVLELLASYPPANSVWDGPDRESLLINIQKVVAKSFVWAWELINTFADKREWQTDVWQAIFRTWWDASDYTEEQRNKILGFVSKNLQLEDFLSVDILTLLESWLDKREDSSTFVRLDLVEELADRLFESTKDQSVDEAIGENDWLAKAINQIGGRAVIVWLKALSIRRAELKDQWSGLPKDYRDRFREVARGSTPNDQFARIVLASAIDFLFNLDTEWTKEYLLCLFDWDRDALTAEQAWDGFLLWGRWHEMSFNSMLPYTIQMFSRLDSVLPKRRDRLCEMLGNVAAYSPADPWNDGWIAPFLRESDPESREKWAAQFGRYLSTLSEDGTADLWRRWIDNYWSNRNTGIPVPLTDREKEEMILWSIALQSQFADVVKRIVSVQGPKQLSHGTFHRLQDGEIAVSHPEATARLLNHMLSELEEIPYGGCEVVFEMAKGALEGGGSRDNLREVAEALARLGCNKAQDLRRTIEDSDSEVSD